MVVAWSYLLELGAGAYQVRRVRALLEPDQSMQHVVRDEGLLQDDGSPHGHSIAVIADVAVMVFLYRPCSRYTQLQAHTIVCALYSVRV